MGDQLSIHHLDNGAGGKPLDTVEDQALAQGVVEGQQFLNRVLAGAGCYQPRLQKGPGFGGKQHSAVLLQDIERLNTKGVPHQPGSAIGTDKAKGVHAPKALKGCRAFLGIEMQQGLKIRPRGQLVRQSEGLCQLEIVINLPIADDRTARPMQGLPAAVQVDDRQSRMG